MKICKFFGIRYEGGSISKKGLFFLAKLDTNLRWDLDSLSRPIFIDLQGVLEKGDTRGDLAELRANGSGWLAKPPSLPFPPHSHTTTGIQSKF